MRYLPYLFALMSTGASAAPMVVTVNVDSIVHPVTLEIISHAIDQAHRQNASLVLVRLNTPGGMLDATRQIVEKMVASPVPVVTYVAPSGGRAASAGFFILEAGDVAAMAPGTNTGAASPVLLGGRKIEDDVMRRKVENDTTAWLRSIVGRRGRNQELAEKTVTEAKSFSEQEALDQHLVEIIAKNEQELLKALHGREVTRFDGSKPKLNTAGAELVEYSPSWRETIVSAVSDPNIAFILLILGALGIYVEFSSPGLIFPGVAGGIMALLGLSALSVLPINWLGAAMLVLGVALFVLEAKFVSHGILGVGGAVAMVFGALILVDAPPEFRIRWTTAVAVTLPFAAITVFLVSLVIQAQKNKVVTGDSGLVGSTGTARTPLEPSGKIFVQGEYWDAISSTPVPEGARVRVDSIEGLKLHVTPEAMEQAK